MPDTPDYHKYLPNSVRLSLQDMGELAARLGSIITYDRQGEVVWFDDFSHGISKYTSILSGTGAALSLGVSRTGRSGFNMRQLSGTTGAKSVETYTGITLLELTKIGLEIACYFLVPISHFILGIYSFDGVSRYEQFIKVDVTNKKIYVLDGTNTYIEVSDILRVDDPDGTIHHFKLVIDTSSIAYVKFLLDSSKYDLSAYSVYSAANTTAPGIMVYFATFGTGGASQATFINHVILTSNEP